MAISSILLFIFLSFESVFNISRLLFYLSCKSIECEGDISQHDSADDIHECWEIIFHKRFLINFLDPFA